MIPVARPQIDEQEAEAVRRVVMSGWIAQGPETAAFERDFAAWVGAPFACAVANGTVALELSLQALGVGPGDEIVTVSHSFIASANVVRRVGALPVFIDVELATGNMDPQRIDDAVTARTRAVLAVHQFGRPCDLSRIGEIARRRGIPHRGCRLRDRLGGPSGQYLGTDGQASRRRRLLLVPSAQGSHHG